MLCIEYLSESEHYQQIIWYPVTKIEYCIQGYFRLCYFHPSTLAKSFAPSWLRPGQLHLKRKRESIWDTGILPSLKFIHGQWGWKGHKIKQGANISLYTVLLSTITWHVNVVHLSILCSKCVGKSKCKLKINKIAFRAKK